MFHILSRRESNTLFDSQCFFKPKYFWSPIQIINVFVFSYKGNGLFRHHGMQFSTRNIDNDLWADSCANNSSGGWWYSGELNNCLTANLNGKYFQDGDTGGTETGIMWTIWKGENYSLKYAEMKIRRLQDLNTDDIQY